MTRRLFPALLALATLAACADKKPALDADLAADLQLATVQPAQPQLNDGPEAAPEAKAPAPVTRQRTPTRSASPARAPRERRAATPRTDTTTLRAKAPSPVVEVAQQSAPSRFHGIGAGSSFSLATRAQVCTNSRPGDKLVATTTDAVAGDDGAMIPEGSTVVLEVASVTPGDSPESARISLRVRAVVLDDVAHSVDGDVEVTSGLERGPAAANSSDKRKVIGGAIAGAVIGQVLGRDTRSTVIGAAAGAAAGTAAAAATRKYHACLPAGARVRVTTTGPIAL